MPDEMDDSPNECQCFAGTGTRQYHEGGQGVGYGPLLALSVRYRPGKEVGLHGLCHHDKDSGNGPE